MMKLVYLQLLGRRKQMHTIGEKLLAGQNLQKIMSSSVYWKRPSWKSHKYVLVTLAEQYPVEIPCLRYL